VIRAKLHQDIPTEESGPKPVHIHKIRELVPIQVHNNKYEVHLHYVNIHNKTRLHTHQVTCNQYSQ
jgi:hypothetical protein